MPGRHRLSRSLHTPGDLPVVDAAIRNDQQPLVARLHWQGDAQSMGLRVVGENRRHAGDHRQRLIRAHAVQGGDLHDRGLHIHCAVWVYGSDDPRCGRAQARRLPVEGNAFQLLGRGIGCSQGHGRAVLRMVMVQSSPWVSPKALTLWAT